MLAFALGEMRKLIADYDEYGVPVWIRASLQRAAEGFRGARVTTCHQLKSSDLKKMTRERAATRLCSKEALRGAHGPRA